VPPTNTTASPRCQPQPILSANRRDLHVAVHASQLRLAQCRQRMARFRSNPGPQWIMPQTEGPQAVQLAQDRMTKFRSGWDRKAKATLREPKARQAVSDCDEECHKARIEPPANGGYNRAYHIARTEDWLVEARNLDFLRRNCNSQGEERSLKERRTQIDRR
jgi:hypothetical protein